MEEAFCYSMWEEPETEKTMNISNGKFILTLNKGVPIISATITIDGKSYSTDRALIDTGCNQTIVFDSLISKIDAKPVRATSLSTANGKVMLNVYSARVELPAWITAEDVHIIHSHAPSVMDVLIGMDILSNGTLTIDGQSKRFSFEVK